MKLLPEFFARILQYLLEKPEVIQSQREFWLRSVKKKENQKGKKKEVTKIAQVNHEERNKEEDENLDRSDSQRSINFAIFFENL